jgi:hypothetical protein
MKTTSVPFYLHVCTNCCEPKKEGGAPIKVMGVSYENDFSGKIDLDADITEDKLSFVIPEFAFRPVLGDAADIAAVKIRVCEGDDVTIHAIYKDPIKTAMTACCHGGGCACYAAGCWC